MNNNNDLEDKFEDELKELFAEMKEKREDFIKFTKLKIKINKTLLNLGLFLMVSNTMLATIDLYQKDYLGAAIQVFMVLIMIYTVKSSASSIVRDEKEITIEAFLYEAAEQQIITIDNQETSES